MPSEDPNNSTTETEALRTRLEAVLAEAVGDRTATVADLRRLPAGASRHTWSFTLTGQDTEARDLILRMDAPGGLEADAMGLEAALMAAAWGAGVPSPEILATSTTDDDLGAAYVVMSRIEGESIPRRILRDPAYADARTVLAAQCGTYLARIHAIDPSTVPGLDDSDELEKWRKVLDGYGHPHPAFELAFRWLESNRPAAGPLRVVHGDYRNGNFIVGPGGINAVLDWELAHLGDPLEDLGWLCVRAWRFGEPGVVGGFGSVEDLVSAYEAESGTVVDREALHWWMVLGTLKWGVICVHQTERHRSGANRSVDLAMVGRRVAEVEWDLLDLLP